MDIDSFFKDIYYEENGKKVFKILVNGNWIKSSSNKTQDVISPINLNVIASIQLANNADVELAIKSAYSKINVDYDVVSVLKKAKELIEKYKEDFINDIMIESAKTRNLAEGEVNTTIERFDLINEDLRRVKIWDKNLFGKEAKIIREPIGVVLAISSFNYPLFSMASKVIPALLGKNSVIGKPSLNDPIVSLMFFKILQEAGVPDGVINVITGLSSEIGDQLVKDDRIQMISLTGSTNTGKHIMSVCGIKRLHLELGGKGNAIVLNDADLQLTAEKIIEGSLKYSGQRCDAISRVLVPEKIHDKLVNEIIKSFDQKHPDIVPLINEDASKKVVELINDAIKNGAKVLRGGKSNRNFVEATILDNVPLLARIAWEETFGPVITIIPVKDEKEAIAVAKESEFGLDSCIFGKRNVMKYAKMLDDGSVTINNYPSHGTGFYPFGGNKNSGIGREGIGYSLIEMTRIKTIKISKS